MDWQPQAQLAPRQSVQEQMWAVGFMISAPCGVSRKQFTDHILGELQAQHLNVWADFHFVRAIEVSMVEGNHWTRGQPPPRSRAVLRLNPLRIQKRLQVRRDWHGLQCTHIRATRVSGGDPDA